MIVSAQGLGYRYPGAAEPVLQGLDFEIEEGEVFGFLGPNGAGKSTTQKLLTRILRGLLGAASGGGSRARPELSPARPARERSPGFGSSG